VTRPFGLLKELTKSVIEAAQLGRDAVAVVVLVFLKMVASAPTRARWARHYAKRPGPKSGRIRCSGTRSPPRRASRVHRVVLRPLLTPAFYVN
jgi:hypothetical protein